MFRLKMESPKRPRHPLPALKNEPCRQWTGDEASGCPLPRFIVRNWETHGTLAQTFKNQ